MSAQTEAIALLENQQKAVNPRSPQWMVGEQLKDICRREPRSAELLLQDLKVEAMSITAAEKKIKAFADSHKTGSFSCVTPAESDRILREFYGLPAPGELPAAPEPVSAASAGSPGASLGPEVPHCGTSLDKIIDLSDFL